MYNSSSSRYSTATGYNALYRNTTGSYNTANGFYALYNNTTGGSNTANGYYALYSNTTGNYNTADGYYALYYNTTGAYNTAIGYWAGFFNGGAGTLNNTTIIGNNAAATQSDQVVIGNSSISSAKIAVNWSITSDGRAKKNIQENVPGLAFINQLQPVTYSLNLDALDELQQSDDPKINAFRDSLRMALSPEEKAIMAKSRADKEKEVYSGFMAQDVEKAALSVGYNFNGVDAPENGKGSYGLRYAEFVVPLVKAVQELSAKNDLLVVQNNKQQEQINELTGLVNKLLGKDADSSTFRSENSGASVAGLANLADVVSASLEQNIPNPFNHTTVIHYTLPETCTSAKILITNTAGRAIQQIPLSISGGHDSVTIKGGSLQAGVYLYSLICDGKVVDTKRMVLTK